MAKASLSGRPPAVAPPDDPTVTQFISGAQDGTETDATPAAVPQTSTQIVDRITMAVTEDDLAALDRVAQRAVDKKVLGFSQAGNKSHLMRMALRALDDLDDDALAAISDATPWLKKR